MDKGGVDFAAIPGTAVRVLTAPTEFFREMPKTGGFVEPLVFAVAMGVVGGLIQSIVSLLGLHAAAGMVMGVASVIVVPVAVAILGFVGAAILFAIWKVLGSQESYETAYRCGAYLAALAPVSTLLGLLPYVGGALGIALATYYIVQASVSAHGVALSKSWAVFGGIGALLIFMTMGAEVAARRVARQAENLQVDFGKSGQELQKQLEKLQQEAERRRGQ